MGILTGCIFQSILMRVNVCLWCWGFELTLLCFSNVLVFFVYVLQLSFAFWVQGVKIITNKRSNGYKDW